MDFIIDRAKLVEVQITSTAAGGTNSFPVNLNDLNNAKIHAIQIITSTQLTTAPSGRPVTTAAMMVDFVVTIADENGSLKRLDQVPAYSTNRELNAGRFYTFKPFKWNPSSSKIQVLAAGLATTDSILFMFYYTPL